MSLFYSYDIRTIAKNNEGMKFERFGYNEGAYWFMIITEAFKKYFCGGKHLWKQDAFFGWVCYVCMNNFLK